MNILLIDNNFEGAYGSVRVFLSEINRCLKMMKHNVFYSRSVLESIELMRNHKIDFSLGIGKYFQKYQEVPLYEYMKVVHYQWIIDNPYKIDIDEKSEFIKYLVIDEQFSSCMRITKNNPLYLPLGTDVVVDDEIIDLQKKEGIVFSGQIRDINEIFKEVKNSRYKKEVALVIEQTTSCLDDSFIDIINGNRKEKDEAFNLELFRLSNSYIRAYKRQKVLSAIMEYPVYIFGDVKSELLKKKKNIKCLGLKTYRDVFGEISKYTYAINIEPNFKEGVHDRVTRSLANGCLPITNFSNFQCEYFKDNILLYHYFDVGNIEERISMILEDEYYYKLHNAQKIIKDFFSWQVLMDKLIKDYLEG